MFQFVRRLADCDVADGVVLTGSGHDVRHCRRTGVGRASRGLGTLDDAGPRPGGPYFDRVRDGTSLRGLFQSTYIY